MDTQYINISKSLRQQCEARKQATATVVPTRRAKNIRSASQSLAAPCRGLRVQKKGNSACHSISFIFVERDG